MKAERERTYRRQTSTPGLVSFAVQVAETDLLISADRDLTEAARRTVYTCRSHLERYIETRPAFLKSLIPLDKDKMAPAVVRDMLEASRLAGVGPMASVAGAVAERVGVALLESSRNVIVENGGDIFLRVDREVRVAILAGKSPLSGRISLKIRPEKTPLGVCTSSATVGHSLSLGRADAVTVLAGSAALADAAATSIGNVVADPSSVERGLQTGREIVGVLGVLIVIGDRMGAWGDLELA